MSSNHWSALGPQLIFIRNETIHFPDDLLMVWSTNLEDHVRIYLARFQAMQLCESHSDYEPVGIL